MGHTAETKAKIAASMRAYHKGCKKPMKKPKKAPPKKKQAPPPPKKKQAPANDRNMKKLQEARKKLKELKDQSDRRVAKQQKGKGKAQNILKGVKAEIESVKERLEVAKLPGVNKTPKQIQDLKDRLTDLKKRQKQLEGK